MYKNYLYYYLNMDQVSIWVLRDNKPIKFLNCWSSLNNNYYSSHFGIDIENKLI